MALSQLVFYRTSLLNLAEEDAKPVEVLRTGTFIDRNGKEVEITGDDLDAFVTNFKAGAAGQEVPIDIDHERREAGGWIKSLVRNGDRLLAEIDWNELGRQLVGDKVYRYMSATIDLAAKTIKAISLVNFPAVKGLKPVELSEGIFGFEQQGFFEVIYDMVASIVKLPKPIELADGMPGSVTISQFLQASIHKIFTNHADNLALAGYLSDDERKQLSSAIGDALETFSGNVGEAGNRIIPAREYWPNDFSEPTGNQTAKSTEGENDMTEQEKAELREQIRDEERKKVEAELTQKQQAEAELREQIRKEEKEKAEAELKAKFERRQGFAEFAEKICNGPVALSVKPEEVVEFMEQLPDDAAVEQAKTLFQAKIVQFQERGSNGDGRPSLKPLPDYARKDVVAGDLTIKELFDAKVIDGKPEEYDLAEFSTEQKGF